MLVRIFLVIIFAGTSFAAFAEDEAITQPANCPQVVGPLEFTNLVEGAVNGTLIGDDGVEASIDRAFASLQCLGEPVS